MRIRVGVAMHMRDVLTKITVVPTKILAVPTKVTAVPTTIVVPTISVPM
jgi:hypothetical protein